MNRKAEKERAHVLRKRKKDVMRNRETRQNEKELQKFEK